MKTKLGCKKLCLKIPSHCESQFFSPKARLHRDGTELKKISEIHSKFSEEKKKGEGGDPFKAQIIFVAGWVSCFRFGAISD